MGSLCRFEESFPGVCDDAFVRTPRKATSDRSCARLSLELLPPPPAAAVASHLHATEARIPGTQRSGSGPRNTSMTPPRIASLLLLGIASTQTAAAQTVRGVRIASGLQLPVAVAAAPGDY